jgi:Tfp pilus assembly protein PilN
MDVGKHFFGFDFFEKGGLRESFHFPFREESARAKELSEAFRSVSLRGSASGDGKPGVWAFGEEANAVLVNELRQDLSADTNLIQGLKKLEFAESPQKLTESYASIGLALRGLQKARWTLNLLPLTHRKKVSRIGFYLAVLLAAAALVLAGVMIVRPVLEEREELRQVLAKVKEKKPEIEAVDALQKKKEQMEKEVRDFLALKGEETGKIEVLRELAEILPPTTWIWNIKIKSRDVELNGFADSAADLISILDKSPVFEKVEFSAPVVKEGRLFGDKVKERFKISAKIERAR